MKNNLTTRETYELVDSKIDTLRREVSKRFDHLEENHINTIYRKIDRITFWLILLLGGLAVNLFLVIIGR